VQSRAELIQQMKDRIEKFRGTEHYFELRREIHDFEKNGLQCISIEELIKKIPPIEAGSYLPRGEE